MKKDTIDFVWIIIMTILMLMCGAFGMYYIWKGMYDRATLEMVFFFGLGHSVRLRMLDLKISDFKKGEADSL